MSALERIRERATALNKTVVLTEGNDARILQAAENILLMKMASVIILGDADKILSANSPLSSYQNTLRIINPIKNEFIEKFAKQFYQLRKEKGISPAEAKKKIQHPLYFGAMLVKNGIADAGVSGAVHFTGDVIRAGAQTLGLAKESAIASSTFLMILQDDTPLTYGDCGVVPYPNAKELATITLDSAESHQLLTGETPRVAMLSFSTKGSAKAKSANLIQSALKIIKKKNSGLIVDGELQFDSAIEPDVAKRKAPNSVIQGDANVFIFPDLDAGNIAYKITERIGKAIALGPLLQGLSKPWMDLSRGCSVDDIVNVSAIACVKCETEKIS